MLLCLRKYRDNRIGAIALEFALILPVLLMIVFSIVQFSSIYFHQNAMYSLSREAVRRLAVGAANPTDAKTWLEQELLGNAQDYAIDIFSPGALAPDDDSFTVQISIPMSVAAILDPLGYFGTNRLETSISMRQES